MASHHVEIHDPLYDCNNLATCDRDPESTSASGGMGDTVEFRMLMVYAQRRRPRKDSDSTLDSPNALNGDLHPTETPPSTETPTENKKEKKGRKRNIRKGLLRHFTCIKPKTTDDEPPSPASLTIGESVVSFRGGPGQKVVDKEDGKLEDVVRRLTEIVDEISFTPPTIELDSPDDDVEKVIALLLREAGDRLNEEELKRAGIAKELFLNYSFFEKLMKAFLTRMGLIATEPDALGPQASPKTQIAVACEVTERLTALHTLPMSRMLDHGARYLQVHHSTWAQQHGGYEEIFHSDNEDDLE